MIEMFFYKKTYRWIFCGILVLSIICFLAYFNHLRKMNKELKKQVQQFSFQLKACQETNAELIRNIEEQQEKYQKKVSELLKKANKPPKVIEVPRVIEKPVYVTDEECKKMAIMIDEFIKLQGK